MGLCRWMRSRDKLRDTCGRLYQRLLAEADEVTQIWYGIPEKLKKRGEFI